MCARPLVLVGCIAFSLFTTSAHAAWVPFNVAAAPGQQFSQQAISDGAGGTITVWIDTRNSAFDIYVQHLLASDAVDPSWPANGLPIGTLQDGAPTIASDGAGGAIVAWINTTAYNVVAQHVLANGTIDPAWPGGGVLVASGANQRIGVQEIPDGSGGVIIAWSDARNTGTTDRDIYAHRVRSTGIVDPAWTVNGVAVCTAANPQDRPAVVSDGAGGIIITWEDDRSGLGLDVYAQRISSTGTVVAGWTANGVALSTAANDQFGPMICSDGAAGAIVEWTDTRGGGEDVYAMRVRSTGALGSGWHANGEVISDASNNQELKSLIADGSGGAISSWIDFRVGDGTTDVYVQKITGASATSWTTDGAAVCTAPKNQTEPVLAPDGSGGAFLAWHDRRFETSPTQAELFLHHVLSTGAQDPAWPANGNRVTFDGLARVAQGHEPALVANGSGGATVVWDGSVDDLYALNLNATWTALYPLATSFTPEGAGVLSRNPDRLSYASGTIVTLTATPNPGHTFVAWNGDASGSTNPLQLTMSSARNVSAIFDGYALNVAVSPGGSGTVSKSPNQSLYVPGTQVTLTAVPTGGYQFVNWSGDVTGSINPVVKTMGNGAVNVTATFALAPPSCGNWSPALGANPPSARSGSSMVWDPVRHRMLVFGGLDNTGYLNDVWQFTWASGWTRIIPAGIAPTPRDHAGLIYDPVRDRLLVIQGNGPGPPTDVVALSLAGTPTWSAVSPVGGPPPGTYGFSAVYDPIRDRVLRFAGRDIAQFTYNNDLWSLSLSGTPTWVKLAPSGPLPGARALHAAVYDPTGDRMVIHGGVNLGGTHALDLATLTWSTLFNIGPEIYHAAAVYDPVRQRMVLTGGNGIVSQPGGVYALSLKTPAFWASAPVGGLAFNRYEHTAAFDPDLDLVMIFGGRLYDLSGLTSDPWRLDCAGGFWLQTAGDQGKVNAYPPKACYSPGEPVTLQAVGNADYAFSQWAGDASGTSSVIDITMNANMAILAQFHTGPVGVGEMPLSFALEDIHPNPNSGPVQVTFVLPREARVKLAVYDLSGRIVGRLVDGSMVAGRHTATWDGRTNGVAAAAGIYFVRFDTPAGSWVHRVALLR